VLCQDEIWKILYRRDISSHSPSSSYLAAYKHVIQETRNKLPKEVLVYAAENGYEKLVKRMIGLGKLDEVDYDNAMVVAAEGGHRDIVEE